MIQFVSIQLIFTYISTNFYILKSDNIEVEKEDDDLNTSSTNLDVHHRRTDPDEGDHQVLYAKLKHPIRPSQGNFPDHVCLFFFVVPENSHVLEFKDQCVYFYKDGNIGRFHFRTSVQR